MTSTHHGTNHAPGESGMNNREAVRDERDSVRGEILVRVESALNQLSGKVDNISEKLDVRLSAVEDRLLILETQKATTFNTVEFMRNAVVVVFAIISILISLFKK